MILNYANLTYLFLIWDMLGAVHKWCHSLKGKGWSAKRWHYSISLFSEMGDMGGGSVQNLKNGWHHLWTGVGQPLSRTKYLVLLFNYIFHITFSNNNYESTTHLYSTFVYFDEKTIFESKSWFCKTIFFHSLHTCNNPQKIQLFLCQIFQCTRKC